jgi:hypothetical protein
MLTQLPQDSWRAWVENKSSKPGWKEKLIVSLIAPCTYFSFKK